MMEIIQNLPDDAERRRRVHKERIKMTDDRKDLTGMPPSKMAELIHELQVHQTELKTQNEELRSIQGELEKAQCKYSHLYDFAPVGYFTVSEKGIVKEANLTGAAMIGTERSTLIGKPFFRLVFREDQDIFYQHQQRLLETETSQSCELRLVKIDGHAFHAHLEGMVTGNKGDDSREIRVAVSDITERNLSEKKIKQYSEKLEKQVDFLQRMEAMGTFAGGIVHDFTNLLTTIISYSSFALNGVGTKNPARKDIEKIILNAKHGLSMTHWLLLFCRDKSFERKITNLNELIIDMKKVLRRVITKKIDLVMSLEPDLSRVNVNPAQMELMIINLVVNAVDAMPKGGVLTIATENEKSGEPPVQKDGSDHPEPKIALSVSDTGIGMDEETLSKIFEPFFTTKKKGTGLGLSITLDAVHKSGGFIRAYSRPGRGSTIKIYLPGAHEK